MPELQERLLALLREPIDRLDKAFKAFFGRIEAGETPGYPRRKSARWWKFFGPIEVKPGMVKALGGGRYNVRLKGGLAAFGLNRIEICPLARIWSSCA